MYIEELYEDENISSYWGVSHPGLPAFALASGLMFTDHSAGDSKSL